MNKKAKNLIFLLIIFLLNSCSFDNKTGIWTHDEKERISKLEKKQKKEVVTIYSSQNIFLEEILFTGSINLTKPKKNLLWEMSGLNLQNFAGHIYLPSINNKFLKKKIGKNKFSASNNVSSPLIYNNNIFLSDDTGSVYSITRRGKINWKKNIYKKIHKKIYKNLSLFIYKEKIFVSDNVGFIYSINSTNGKLNWIKNHEVPIRSNLRVYDDKIFIINQDNRLVSFDVKDGSKIWDIRSISTFIKSQNFLSIAVSKHGDVIVINSSGDLFKTKGSNVNIYWSLSTSRSMLMDATDFFKSSEIVINNDDIIFSAGSSIFSHNFNDGKMNWEQELSSIGTPIIDGKNIFFVTENGYFVIMNKDTGKIISSNNILKILKRKKRITKITGFILGSGKIYSVTLNGYLIVSSAVSGKVEFFKKIGDPIVSSPIINNGKLFILTKNSRIVGLN